MAVENFHTPISLVAVADYSSTGQHRFVTINSSGQALRVAAANEDIVAGVLRNAPLAGGAASIQDRGLAKVELGATVNAGAAVTTDNVGRAVTATTGQFCHGICIEGGAVGNIGTVLLKDFTLA